MTSVSRRWTVEHVDAGGVRLGVRWRPPAEGADAAALVAILHQSPLSGWTHEPVLDHLDHAGPVAIFDTPGFGFSDPLPQPSRQLGDYAERLWAAIDRRAGGRPVVLVGQHTGAHLAMLLAIDHPDVVRAVVFHGLSLYTDAERAERSANYTPPIETAADGSHLTLIWQRVRELYPDVALELLDRSVCDYLRADPDYAHAYRAVFDLALAPVIEAFRASGVPSAVLVGDRDLIAGRQGRVREAFGAEIVELAGLTDFAAWEDPPAFCAALDGLIAALAGQERG